MPTAFSRAEQRLNAAVSKHLANASAVHAGGDPFPVLFDRGGVQPFGEVVDTVAARASFERAYAPTLVRGGSLHIDGVAYMVESDVEPDASGWVTVDLFPAG